LDLLRRGGLFLVLEVGLPVSVVLIEVLLEGDPRVQLLEGVVQQVDVVVAAPRTDQFVDEADVLVEELPALFGVVHL
jgi:hypothetical protein